MSLDVRQELIELAGRARQYADAAAVLREVHRRRRRRTAMAAASAVVAVVGVGLPVLLNTVAPDPTPEVAAAALNLPAVIDPPNAAAPDLPTDRGVGASALVYQATPGGATYLVAPDGTQYRVPITPLPDTALREVYQQLPVALSPDGRWLVIVGSDTVARDLTSTDVRHLGPFAIPQAWSPDGRWLIHAGPGGSVLRDIESNQSWSISDLDTAFTAVPDSDGRAIVPWFYESSGTIVLRWLDPVHGAQPSSVPVRVRGVLGPQETVVWHGTVEYADGSGCSFTRGWVSQINGSRVLIGIFDQSNGQPCDSSTPIEPVDYLVVSAATGRATGRLGLPAGARAPVWYGDAIAYPTQASASARITINLVSPSGQPLSDLTSLPAGAIFVLAGATLPATGPATQ